MTSWLFFPSKGKHPQTIVYRITPNAQISIEVPIAFYLPVRVSGAMYFNDPASILSTLKLVATPAIPKSTNLT